MFKFVAVHVLADFHKLFHDTVRVTFLAVSIPTNLSLQECEALVQTSLNEEQPLRNLVFLNQRSDLDISALADHTHIFLEAIPVIYLVTVFVAMAVAATMAVIQLSLVVVTMTMAVAVTMAATMVSMPILLFGASARSLLLHTKFNNACWLRDGDNWAKKNIIDRHECFW